MADVDEERRAAKILLSLRSRKLTRWPDWMQRPPKELAAPSVEESEAELPPPPEWWPKRPRGPLRVRASGWSPSLDGLYARLWHPAPACARSSSEEETAWSPPRGTRVKREFLRPASGSDPPSTSGVERKEAFMAASSPETPFDYAAAAAARSGASSSGDEGARSTAKRKVRGASRSGAPSSGDEGCSSPAKRTRPAGVKVEVPKIEENYRDEKGHLLFDLNEDVGMAW